jgi:hypothetical protein
MYASAVSRRTRLLPSVLLFAFASACATPRVTPPSAPTPSSDLLVVLGPRVGEAELVARFGAEHVRRGDVPLGEGETEPGTILFPGDRLREVQIVWMDPGGAAPALVQVSGDRGMWMIEPGIALGVRLDSLERLNGRPFELAGFEWDYEGTVMSWRGGALERLNAAGTRVVLRLVPTREKWKASTDLEAVAGEGPFRSDHPVMRRLNPRIVQMMVLYD